MKLLQRQESMASGLARIRADLDSTGSVTAEVANAQTSLNTTNKPINIRGGFLEMTVSLGDVRFTAPGYYQLQIAGYGIIVRGAGTF